MFKRSFEHGVCPMPSVALMRYFYPNISGWEKFRVTRSHNSTCISSNI